MESCVDPSTGSKDTDLVAQLKAHSQWIDSVISLIPVGHYFPQRVDESLLSSGRRLRRPDDERKLLKKMAHEMKKAKFDPSSRETVKDVQQSLQGNTEVPRNRNKSLSALRAKLDARLAQLRSNRGMQVQKKEMSSRLLAQHSNNNADRDQQSEARETRKGNVNANGKQKVSLTTIRGQLDAEGKMKVPLAYSTFDFSGPQPVPAYLSPSRLRLKKHSKVATLRKALRQRQRLQSADRQDSEKAKELVDPERWSLAEKRLRGEKLADPKTLKHRLASEKRRHQRSAEEWKERQKAQQESMNRRQELRALHIRERRSKVTYRHQKKPKTKPMIGRRTQRPGFEGRRLL